jgi:hypothetical protein
MAIILSVSVDAKQKQFIDDLKLSPSSLLQRVLNEMMQNSMVNQEELKGMHKNISLLQGTIRKQGTFIDKHGLFQEYLQFEDV